MNFNGILFIAVIVAVIGVAKLVWSYINLFYEVQELKDKLGKK